jgi:hypothetical protein
VILQKKRYAIALGKALPKRVNRPKVVSQRLLPLAFLLRGRIRSRFRWIAFGCQLLKLRQELCHLKPLFSAD